MAIKGDLWSMDLTQVFQMLALNQKEGQLCIDLGGGRRRAVLFCRYGITHLPICDLNDEATLHHVLKRRNIAGGSLFEARKRYERPDKRLVEALTEVGLIKRSWLLPLLRERIQSQLLDLFFLTAGKFEFHEESVQKHLSGLEEEERDAFFFSVEEIVMEGSHRVDEWSGIRQLVPTLDEIYCAVRPVNRAGADAMAPEMAEVLEALNGVRDVNEVVEITQLGNYRVCGALADLLRAGTIQPADSRMLAGTALGLFQTGRLDEALKVFHRLLHLTEDEPDVRLKIALIYERQGEFLKAAEHYRKLADYYLREGAIVQGYEYYQTVLRLLPTDLEVLGRLIGLYLRYSTRVSLESFDVVKGARTLVQILIEMGERDRAIDLLQRLVKSEINLVENRTLLIELYRQADRVADAVGELDQIGRRMLQQGNPSGAARVYRQILKLEPGHREAARILDEVDEDRRRFRARRRRALGLVRSTAYLGVFVAGYFYYGNVASRELRGIDLDPSVLRRQSALAERQLREFVDRYPFSLAAFRARTLLRSVETELAAQRREEDLRTQRHASEAQHRLVQAKDCYEQARLALRRQDLERALERMQQAARLGAAHAEWRRSVGLDVELGQLQRYHDEARDLRERGEERLAAGRPAEAHALLVRLHQDYPHAAAARHLTVPVLLESEPAGAAVCVEGEEPAGVTPFLVRLPVDRVARVEFSRAGFRTVQLSVQAAASPGRIAVLPRLPALVIETRLTLQSTPEIHADLLVVGGRGGRVLAVDLGQERPAWTQRFTGLNNNLTSPAVGAAGVFTGSVDPGLFCLDRGDGRRRWRLNTRSYFSAAPLLAGDLVVAGDTAGTLWGVWAEKGNEAWRCDTGGPITTAPASACGRVYVGNKRGRVLAVRLVDGAILQQATLEGGVHVAPLLAEDRLHVLTDAGVLYALDSRSLRTRWEARVEEHVVAPLVGAGPWIYVTAVDGRLLRFEAATGRQGPPRLEVAASLLAAPLVRPEAIYLGGMDGRLRVIDEPTLEERWSLDLGSPIQGAPVEWNGMVIVTTHAGTVCGFVRERPGAGGKGDPPDGENGQR
ncbi:MAG: PQQ-binding-like beta-propeller repeat protein [Planctomycetes bacterium]|nr:PQQ-binding-like beta-propeller repeat protein [Planctomycetota bacterium]